MLWITKKGPLNKSLMLICPSYQVQWFLGGTAKLGFVVLRFSYFSYDNCARNGLSLGPSLYFVIHSHHAQTMTHTPPSADSILVRLLVVSVACDSD
jgi:hypothetical protein